MEKILTFDALTLGVCYYPEHWPEELWASDIQRMLDAGIKIIRVAEFAWSEFEPTEGNFGGGLFDRFMDFISTTEMNVIFCTPTATPPAWLTEKYPETLNARQDGTLIRHGLRKHYNYNSEVFRDKTRLIVSHVAQRFGTHPSIIGWQLDNEFNWGIDEYYSEADHRQFRLFLKDKYGTLEQLNKAWGAVFWNQKYTDWEEVHLPRPNVKEQPNPHLALDAKRFFSWSTLRYCNLQSEILRNYIPAGIFITHNGDFKHIDHKKMTNENLDFLTHNHYPSFGFNKKLRPPEKTPLLDRMFSFGLAKMRGISPIFGVMEHQSGAGGWLSEHFQPAPKPGQMRLWTFQSIAHGCDFISYFRWRTCTFGTEMYWHGILDHDNRDNRRLHELKQIRDDMQKITAVTGGRYQAGVGLLYDYDNIWDGELDLWHGPIRDASDRNWFVALQETHTPFDYVNMKHDRDKFAKYKLLIFPHGTIITAEDAQALKNYVKSGGTLIMGTRTGYKNENAHCRMEPLPGPLSDLFGITIDEYTYLSYLEQNRTATWGNETLDTILFNDIITPEAPTCKVLATYNEDYYKGKPALTENTYGKGKAYYLGAGFSTPAAKMFLNKLNFSNPFGKDITLPQNCEIALRKNEKGSFLFALNYSNEPAKIVLKNEMEDLLTGQKLTGDVEMEAFGVRVFRMP